MEIARDPWAGILPSHDDVAQEMNSGDKVPSSSPAQSAANVKRLLPWLVAVAFFMQALDTTILNTAVPAIAKALAVTPLSMKSVLASYTLSLAVSFPLVDGWRTASARDWFFPPLLASSR